MSRDPTPSTQTPAGTARSALDATGGESRVTDRSYWSVSNPWGAAEARYPRGHLVYRSTLLRGVCLFTRSKASPPLVGSYSRTTGVLPAPVLHSVQPSDQSSVSMPVMDIGIMGVCVDEWLVPMRVTVWLSRWIVRCVCVLVMRIVHMQMLVFEHLVDMFVLVMFGQVY